MQNVPAEIENSTSKAGERPHLSSLLLPLACTVADVKMGEVVLWEHGVFGCSEAMPSTAGITSRRQLH